MQGAAPVLPCLEAVAVEREVQGLPVVVHLVAVVHEVAAGAVASDKQQQHEGDRGRQPGPRLLGRRRPAGRDPLAISFNLARSKHDTMIVSCAYFQLP